MYSQIIERFGEDKGEELILIAMALLGKLPDSYFICRDREQMTRVMCSFSTVWINITESSDDGGVESDLFIVELHDAYGLANAGEFRTSSIKKCANVVVRHEIELGRRTLRQNRYDFDGIDTRLVNPEGYRT